MTDFRLQSYADIRKFAPAGAFVQAMTFTSWHNRLSFTPMLEPWEVLVVALANEIRPIGAESYALLKALLEEKRGEPVVNIEQAKIRAKQVLSRIN